ncbi:MAG: carotenoid oxygenase family protein [Ilumatobacter sp.]|nr:carotenoid oxygenase family protein [Ilumatobacter sp.]
MLTVVYDATTDQSELHILDAEDISGPEVATIALPQRVPFGFHGNWVPDTSVAPE